MGGRGYSSAVSRVSVPVENSELDNARLRDSYIGAEATDREAESLYLWSRGDYHGSIRDAQRELAMREGKLWADFRAGRFGDDVDEAFMVDYMKGNRYNMVDNSGSLARADDIEGYIAKSPNFTGTLYRGITQHGIDYETVSKMEVGDSASFDSLTSWSTARGHALNFSEPYDVSGNAAPYTVLITSGKSKSNALIAKYSANLESEVVLSGKNSFKLAKKVTVDNEHNGRPVTYYYFE